jgi:hypothetical protein
VRVKRAVYGFAWVLLATVNAAAGSRSQDAWSWAQQNADAAWKQVTAGLHPIEQDRASEWTAHVVAEDGWGRTAELLVRQPWNGVPVVAYARAVDQNVLTQLHDLHESEPGVSLPEAVRRLRVRSGSIDAIRCPALGGLAERLAKIQVPALQENQLTLHAPGFDVTLSPAHRSDRRLSVEEGEDDLARWCAEILAAVVACEGVPPRQ